MPDSLEIVIVVVVAELIPALIAAYAAYWAFSVRKALAGRIYRVHALWMGVLLVMFAMSFFLTYSTNPIINDGITIFTSSIFVLLFAFIDSTIPLARRSDPLLRNILGWSRLRIGLWAGAAILAGLNLAPAVSPTFTDSSIGMTLENQGWFVVATFLFGVSGIALVIGARRSRDPILRKNLMWLGLALVNLILIFAVYTGVSAFLNLTTFDFYYSYYAIPSGLLSILEGVLLYKAVRSLAPIDRLQPAAGSPRAPESLFGPKQAT